MARARSITNLDIHTPTGRNARLIARTRLEELYEWDKYVDDPYQVHELHNLRIAAKRLRYTLEIFSDVLPEACSSVLKEVEQIQEELGALHDSDVMVALLRLCLLQYPQNGSSDTYQIQFAPGITFQQSVDSQHNSKNTESLKKNASYESAHVEMPYQLGKGDYFLLNPDMVASLLDPAHVPSPEQRRGLERLLLAAQQKREQQYAAFRQHWEQLQMRDFRGETLRILED